MSNFKMWRHIVPLVVVAVMAFGGALYASPIDWPSNVSGLNGWNGLKLVKGSRCPVCYSLVLPERFGLNNKKEFQILTDLPRKKVDDSMVYDLDGPLFADQDVLNHLLHLALDYSYAPAGHAILNPEKYDMLLGVETSENIIGTHVIPLIRGYSDLKVLINEAEYERFAKYICHWSAGKHDFRNADKLIAQLRERRFERFAGTLSATCKAEKEFMRKHGEKFAE